MFADSISLPDKVILNVMSAPSEAAPVTAEAEAPAETPAQVPTIEAEVVFFPELKYPISRLTSASRLMTMMTPTRQSQYVLSEYYILNTPYLFCL